MMKVLYTFLKDLKVSFKTFYIYIEIIMALIFVVILLFVVPEDFTSKEVLYVHVDSSIESNFITRELEKHDDQGVVFLESRDEIEKVLEQDRNSVGVSISKDDDKVVYDIVLQGYENPKHRNMIEKSLVGYLARELPEYKSVTEITTLNNYSERLTDRINLLPMFLLLNSSFTGLFIVAAYIFMDKEEGTIEAFAVTPAKVWQYLLSKMGMMLFTGFLTGIGTTLLVARLDVNYFYLALLLIVTNAFGTAVGLFIASFYDSIIKAMGAIYVVIITFAFATISYFVPSFSPFIIKILPSYPIIFAFREVFLENPNISFIYYNIAGFGILAVIFFIWANNRFKKTLTV